MNAQPEWYRSIEVRACPVCASPGRPFAAACADAFPSATGVLSDFRRCERCGSVWMDPRPADEVIGKLYARYYTHARPGNAFEVREGLRFARLRRDASRALVACHYGYPQEAPGSAARWAYRALARLGIGRAGAGRLVRYLPARRGRLLDVGCGNGEFLVRMRNLGWDVIGIEPDPAAAAVARAAGLEIVPGRVEEGLRGLGEFDAITVSHVLEHLPDPAEVFARLASHLSPGGSLVAISPNPHGLIARLFRSHWMELDPPRHLVLPSCEAYRRMMRASGLKGRVFTSLEAAAGVVRESLSIRRSGRVGGYRGWIVPKMLAYVALPLACAVVREGGEEIVCIARRAIA